MARPVFEYLLWAPLGEAPVRAFADAYRANDPGIEHELVVAACGATSEHPLEPLLKILEPLGASIELFEGPRIDLRTHRELVDRRPQAEEFVFANSYARPLAPGWLKLVIEALREPAVGIVGAGGTFETRVMTTKHHLGFLFLPTNRRFPNPHIRTSCFAMTRDAIESINWRDVRTKSDAWSLESGRRGISAQLERQGLRSLVVGRDGRTFESSAWRESATFRASEGRNLLIADLRTDDYANADPAERARLETAAWGSPESA
jgi:hypothetical protein